MSDFEFGQRVRFSRPLARAKVTPRQVKSIFRTRTINKEWLPTPSPAYEGIVIGRRHLSNGKREFEWVDDGGGYYEYTPVEYFTAYLVVQDMRSKPVYVLPEHIEAIA